MNHVFLDQSNSKKRICGANFYYFPISKGYGEAIPTFHCTLQGPFEGCNLLGARGSFGGEIGIPLKLPSNNEVLTIYKHYLYLRHNLNIKTKSPYLRQQLSKLDLSTPQSSAQGY